MSRKTLDTLRFSTLYLMLARGEFEDGQVLRASAPDKYGYPRVLVVDGNRIRSKYVHRMIAEKRLGRNLRSDEIVHHRNGDITDNSEENHLIVTRSEHARLHRLTFAKINFLRAKASREPFRGSTGSSHPSSANRHGSSVLVGKNVG